MARVTVGMPVWNAEQTVRSSIECILGQDYRDLELIISDNGSTDATPDILREYAAADPRVRLVLHEQNRGGSANFSCLPPLATGEYFKWQSGDDLLTPQMIGRAVQVLDAAPDVVLAYGKTTMIDEDGAFWRNHEDRLHLRQEQSWRRMHAMVMRRWLCNPLFGLIRTEPLLSTTLLTPKVSSDVTLLAQLVMLGQFHEMPERMFLRRFAARSCGLGELTKDEVAQWFDPSRMAPRISPSVRVWWDTHVAIAAAPLPVVERVLCTLAYDTAKARRELGVRRYKARLRRSGQAFPTWETLRQQQLPDDVPDLVRDGASGAGAA